MKVRLAAEEYSRHASLRARTPTRCADLLRRRLRVPLASSVGNRPRYPVRLRGHALQPGLAGPGSSWQCHGHARANTRACSRPCWRGFDRNCRSRVRREACATRFRDRRTALNVSSGYLVAGGSEGWRSKPTAAESSRFPAAASPPAISAAAPFTAPQSSAAPCTTPQSPAAALAADACGVGRHGTG